MCYNSSITSTKKVWKCSPIWRVFVVDKVTPSLSPNKENVFRNLADNCQYYLIRLSEGYSLKDNIYGTKVILTFSWYSILHYCYFIYVVYKWAPLFKTLKEQKKKNKPQIPHYHPHHHSLKRRRRKSLKKKNLRRTKFKRMKRLQKNLK